MPDFPTAQAKDDWVKKNAEYFTVIRYLGPRLGYERKEVKTFEEAEILAGRMTQESGRPHMIYAVSGPHDAFLKAIQPQQPAPRKHR